jgi:hypothetical protein
VRSISSRYLCLSAFAAIAFSAVVFAGEFYFEFRSGEFRLGGWTGGLQPPPQGWESVLGVYAANSDTPMLGTYSVEADTLVFRPRFPLTPGIRYRSVYPGGESVLDLPPQRFPRTRVVQIFPSASVLPSNTLKLYLCFSAPMSQGEALSHIQLLDEKGKLVPDAFLDQELWDPDHTRLTVLFDPGRIKRGLAPAREAGAPIVAGKHYTLFVNSAWPDAHGESLGEDFRKAFTGAPAERDPPAPNTWRLSVPKAGTKDPLVVDFPKPMDYALLQRMIEIPGVAGTVALNHDETEWRFTPDAPWKAGDYRLTADSTLEDIAGNHLNRAFDIDLRESKPRSATGKTLALPFSIND